VHTTDPDRSTDEAPVLSMFRPERRGLISGAATAVTAQHAGAKSPMSVTTPFRPGVPLTDRRADADEGPDLAGAVSLATVPGHVPGDQAC
jgi:hypothetical protein